MSRNILLFEAFFLNLLLLSDPDINPRDIPDTSYYQWVVFFLCVQAGLFALPSWIWKMAESGVIRDFGVQDAKSALVLSDDVQMHKLVCLLYTSPSPRD